MRDRHVISLLGLCALLAALPVAAQPPAAADEPALLAERAALAQYSRSLEHPAPIEQLEAVKRLAASLDSALEPAAAIVALSAAGTGVALSSDDDDGTEVPITGAALERATEAALQAMPAAPVH